MNRGGYDFYLYQRSLNESNINFFVVYMGAALAAIVLFLNYFMVNRLLDPVRMLKKGARGLKKATSATGFKATVRTNWVN